MECAKTSCSGAEGSQLKNEVQSLNQSLKLSKWWPNGRSIKGCCTLIVFACRCSFVQELQAKTEQICEMAAVMSEAIHIDDQAIQQEQERMASIESENRGLRELLKISGIAIPAKEEKASPEQTDAPVDGPSSSASQ